MTTRQSNKALKLLKKSCSAVSNISAEDFAFARAYYNPTALVIVKKSLDYLEIRFLAELGGWALIAITADTSQAKSSCYDLDSDDISDISLNKVTDKIKQAILDGHVFW